MTTRPTNGAGEPGHPGLQRLEQAAGGFAMVALDQRESLRTMLARGADPREIPDAAVFDFKRIGIEELSPHASAMLLDRLYAVGTTRPEGLAANCALTLAADVLVQDVGQDVAAIELDTDVTPEVVRDVGAAALKLLVLWSTDEPEQMRADMTRAFIDLCRAVDVPSIVEGIVRPPRGEQWASAQQRHEAVLTAAVELSSHGADLYKCQVPGYLPGDLAEVTAWSRRVTAALACPWVVLSNGVRAEDFTAAVEAACAGGASGFLAGRAIWADTVGAEDLCSELRARSLPRLQRLAAIVATACAAGVATQA